MFAAEFMLPWATTGHRVRSGYNLAGVLQQTRLVPNGFVSVVVVCVLLMPVLAAVTIAADLVDARRAATVTLVAQAALVAACAVAIGFDRMGPRVAVGTVVVAGILLVASRLRLRDVGADRIAVDGE